MSDRPFVDHYETLQLSAGADHETIERVYRLLAKRYHPDNRASGDVDRFNEITEAYEVLSDPRTRAAYDVRHDDEKDRQWQILREGSSDDRRMEDEQLFHRVLSLLYVARRRDPEKGGLAPARLEWMLDTPREHLEFPLWYLKKRNLVEVLESGLWAITVDGVDELGNKALSLPEDRLLTASSASPRDGDAELHAPLAIPGSESEGGDADGATVGTPRAG